jgi:hypothetical protein
MVTKNPAGNGDYEVVVSRSASVPPQWEWEICRERKPLPVRLRETGFKSERTAHAAGKVALRDFLSALEEDAGS